MANFLLEPLPYRMLEMLQSEGGMTFARLFFLTNSQRQADCAACLDALQLLYDFSYVDLKRGDTWELELPPEALRKPYKHLDEITVEMVIARGTRDKEADPLYCAISHLGLSELQRPGYMDRDDALDAKSGPRDGLPSPDDLPTLPFE